MPIYTYQCAQCGHRVELFHTVKAMLSTEHECDACSTEMELVIMAPLLVKVAPDCCYDSPIDGAPITSWEKRKEDLKRNHCTPYDPLIKQDYQARIKREEAELDQSIEAHVEEAVEKMPTNKRAQLYSELTEQGKDLDVTRSTPYA